MKVGVWSFLVWGSVGLFLEKVIEDVWFLGMKWGGEIERGRVCEEGWKAGVFVIK